MDERASYNVETYRRADRGPGREGFRNGSARVGTPAPDFLMPLVDGGTVGLMELLSTGHVVLHIGSFTAPPAMAQLPGLEELNRTYGGRGFSFLFVYTRETHPGENFSPHRSMEQKTDQARRMRDFMKVTLPVAVDDLDGSVHRAYGFRPSGAVVIHRDGTIVARMEWTQAQVIRDVLENLLLRDRAEAANEGGHHSYNEWISFLPREDQEYWDLLDVAGPQARADHERENAPDGR